MGRLALAVAALALAAAGCGDDDVGDGACAAAVIYEDMVYLGEGPLKSDLRPGEPLPGGIDPACHDTIPSDDQPDLPAKLRRIEGVPPEVAVWVPGERRRAIYVNAGSFPALPDHPLHDLLAHRWRPSPRGAPCTVDATVTGAGLSVDLRTEAGREFWLQVSGSTEIEGFDRGGTPILRRDDRVHVVGRCRHRELYARRIEPRA